MTAYEQEGSSNLRQAAARGLVSALVMLGIALAWCGPAAAQSNSSLYLADSQFSDLQTRIFRVDPATGTLDVRADLGTTYSPVLGMAAASGTVLYLAGTDAGPDALCQGNVACLLIRVELDPLSTTPSLVQVIGAVTEGGSMLSGITGMTFRQDGMLYAISQDTESLYTIDPVTAVATRIGTVDLDLHGGDITFDGDDRLWLWSNIGAGDGLYQLDPETAQADLFDLHPYLDMSGLAAIGHGSSLEGSSPLDASLYEANSLIGLTGNSVAFTLDGVPFHHRRGDLDSPFCEDDAGCADENPCTLDECTPGGCRHLAVEDGIACDDGNACTQADTCEAGACIGASPVVCAALDQCHDAGVCDPATGVCSNPEKVNGTACDDGSACTQADSCEAGACVGASPVVCAALDQCHDAGVCDPATGVCSNPEKVNGTACDDGDACTQADRCQAGVCEGEAPVSLEPPDPCYDTPVCDPATGIWGSPQPKPDGIACDDGNICTLGDTCFSGTCQGALRDGDGDAHVDAICGGDDCSDTNPFVWLAPQEVENLTIEAATTSMVSWDSQGSSAGPETRYDLVSGPLGPDTGLTLALGACLQTGGGNSHTDLRLDPEPGDGFWYLARAKNSCGTGTFGGAVRDSDIGACP